MSSSDWEDIGLRSMVQYVESVSMFGADLSDDEQAAKYRKAFVEFPLELL
jgi:hypothetical protein